MFGHRNLSQFGAHREMGLRYWILAILYNKDATGAMIIDMMEKQSMGFWRPSPGSVYPLLSKMVSDGELELSMKENKKYYKITEKGKETINGSWFPWKTFIEPQNTSIERIIEEIENDVEYILEKADEVNKSRSARAELKKIVEKLKKI
ncbi:MAG: PadR family transcriptional regulator [Candidatus Parvarchaeota archaeon]|nr:PadR family transcriptional regulator [Candidatus Parvarchaeota archaeon]